MRNTGEEGFTLIELLLTLLLSSLVVIGFMTVFWTSTRAYELGTSTSDIQYMARRALGDMEKDIKEAHSVTICADASSLLINKTEEDITEYYLNNGNLYRKHGGASIPIAECIKEVKLRQTDKGLVEVTIEAQSKEKKYILSTSAFPRMTIP